MPENIIYQKLITRQNALEKGILESFSKYNSSNLLKAKEFLENSKDDQKLKIAFVGQHNAGKSKIVSALTNDESIKISNRVETDTVEEYEWGEVLLLDTPGLFAGENEEHDIRSMEAIKQADLLIYCITASLFDDLILKDFFDLAYKKLYKSKMILVVNKSYSLEGQLDYDPTQVINNYRESLEKDFDMVGADINDFPVVFIDAKAYINGLRYGDEELIQLSHFDDLIRELNNQIQTNSFLLSIDTRSHKLKNLIEDEISEISPDVDENMLKILRQMELHIIDKRIKAEGKVNAEIERLTNKIRVEGNKIIQRVGREELGTSESDKFISDIAYMEQEAFLNIQNDLVHIQDELNDELCQVAESNRAALVFKEIEKGCIHIDTGVLKDYSGFVNGYKKYSASAKNGSAEAFKKLIGDTDITKLANAKDTQLYGYVKKIGELFHFKFKPWQAAKVTKSIGTILSKVGVVADASVLVVDVGEKILDDAQLKKLQNDKMSVNIQISEMANGISEGIHQQYKIIEDDLFNQSERTISSIKLGMINTAKENKGYIKVLKKLYEEAESIIADTSLKR